jgi:hypothetical protein
MQKLIITGVAGVLIGAVAFSTKPSISQSPSPSPSPTTEPSQPKTRRLTIAVSVSAISDLKVTEGQTLQTGDTIAEVLPASGLMSDDVSLRVFDFWGKLRL